MKITHFTKKAHLHSIKTSGFIELEGFNIEKQALANPNLPSPFGQDISYETLWLDFKKQFQITGRYVWFTEDITCSCISSVTSFEKVAIIFDSEEIGAEKWSDIYNILIHHSNKSKRYLEALNNSAIQNGDDIAKWWVCRERVDLKFGKIEENLNPE